MSETNKRKAAESDQSSSSDNKPTPPDPQDGNDAAAEAWARLPGEDNSKAAESSEQKQNRDKLQTQVYEKELRKLHVELVKLQEWVKYRGLRIVVLFEGRDAAGKGGAIKRMVARWPCW